jgi:Domain of unknown function (DUF4282)
MSMMPPPPPPISDPPPSGGPGQPPGNIDSPGSFFANLFDFSMSRFITPSIIKILYVLGIVIVSLFALFVLIASINNDQPVAGLLLAPLYWFFGVIYTRVLLELVIVLFRIERNTRQAPASPPPPS